MIEVSGLVKEYDGTRALDRVSFSIREPGIYVLLGLNGAGKTTLFKILSGILDPTEGTVEVAGFRAVRERQRRIGFLPEENAIYPDMTLGEYLLFFASLLRVPRRSVLPFYEATASHISLPPWKARIGELSFGQKRKVLFARTLLNDPPVLILDEPVAQVDVLTERAFLRYIRQLAAAGKVIVYSTHLSHLAQSLSDQVLVLHKGGLLRFEATSRLLAGAEGKSLEEVFVSLVENQPAR